MNAPALTRCDMCHKPLKEVRYQITTLLRPDLTLTVGPGCYRKTKKAQAELQARKTPTEIMALRQKIANALPCAGDAP